ncbi:hypothetical protein [Muribacter muris]|nr:hypothetical protein [Muribacter muris]
MKTTAVAIQNSIDREPATLFVKADLSATTDNLNGKCKVLF